MQVISGITASTNLSREQREMGWLSRSPIGVVARDDYLIWWEKRMALVWSGSISRAGANKKAAGE
jgi:hypothetical protein